MTTETEWANVRFTESDNPFETESRPDPGGHGIIDQVFAADDMFDFLRDRVEDREDLLITDPTDSCMVWNPTDQEAGVVGHFSIRPPEGRVDGGRLAQYFDEGNELTFAWGSAAHRSICKMMDTTPERYKKFGNDAEKRFLREHRDWFSAVRDDQTGYVVRTHTGSFGNRIVEGFVPGNFNRVDEYAIVANMMERLDDAKQMISGVNVLDDPGRSTTSFRVIFGEPLEMPDQHPVYCMLDIRYSPVGYASFTACLALWRMICRNGMTRKDLEFTRVNWQQHYRESEDASEARLFRNVDELVGRVNDFAPAMQIALNDLPSLALSEDPEVIIDELEDRRLLPKRHAGLAKARVEARVDGPVETEWDMLNVLTRSAHDLPSIGERQTGENRALRMAMQPDAYSGILVNGFDDTVAKRDLAHIAKRN